MYSVVMVVAMAGAPEAPACCPTFCCPKICLPEIHCPKLCLPKIHCCKPACAPTPCCAPAPVVVAPAPCAPECAPTCAPKHGCCFLSKCLSCFSCGKHGGGYGEPVMAGPAPGCGQVVIPPAPGTYVVPPTQANPPTVPVEPKKEMPKTGVKVG